MDRFARWSRWAQRVRVGKSRRRGWTWGLVAAAFLLASGLLSLSGNVFTYGSISWRHLFTDLYPNVAAGLFDAFLTIVIVDAIARRSDRRQRFRDCLYRLRSDDAASVKDAVRLAREEGWLSSGALNGAGLAGAQLPGESLEHLQVDGADLSNANLEGTDLFSARFRRSNLTGATLDGANLTLADLRQCNLYRASLIGVSLHGADLRGAILKEAQVDGAFRGAKVDDTTVLP